MNKGCIIVKPIVADNKTAMGIIIPSKPKLYQEGVILKIGEIENELLVGDKIMYANQIQTNVDYDGEKCHLINEEYVLAIL